MRGSPIDSATLRGTFDPDPRDHVDAGTMIDPPDMDRRHPKAELDLTLSERLHQNGTVDQFLEE